MIHSLRVILHHWSRSKKIGFPSQSCSRAKSILIPSNTGRFLKCHHLNFPECSAISTHCSLCSLFSLFPHEPFFCPFASSALFHLLAVVFLIFCVYFYFFCATLSCCFIFSPSCMQSPFFYLLLSSWIFFFFNFSLLSVYLSLFYPYALPVFTVNPWFSFPLSMEKEDYHDDSVALHKHLKAW